MAYTWIRNAMRSSRTIGRVEVVAALIIGALPLGTSHAETGSNRRRR
jgi:hypothetical protein